jgi:hypothetical protein
MQSTTKSTTNTVVALNIADLSAFCKSLRSQLTDAASLPSHLALMNMLARSAGYRNYQMLRAKPSATVAPANEKTMAAKVAKAITLPRDQDIPKLIQRTLSHFDTDGRLMRWPTQFSVQQLALWSLWMRLPGKRDLTEREVNTYLDAYNAFGDPVTLRRELVNAKLLWRTKDGRTYRKEAKTPSADAALFIKHLVSLTAPRLS